MAKKNLIIDEKKKKDYAHLSLDWDNIDWDILHRPFIDYKSEEQYKDILHAIRNIDNLHFTTKYILNLELAIFQISSLQILFKYPFPMLIASRGLSKSWMLAVFLLTKSLLLQGHKSVIVGAAFRQSKIIFEYMESIWNNAPVLQDICGAGSGPKRATDMWTFKVGHSIVNALPLGNGDKIRGQRGNTTVVDEFQCLTPQALTETDAGLIRIGDFLSSRASSCINMYGENEFPSRFITTPKPVDVYEVITKRGYNFKCSSKHKVLTQNGFKLAKNLTSEDQLCINNQYKFPDNNIVNKNIAWLLGILTSEGAVNDKYRLSIQMTDKHCVDRIERSVKLIDPKIKISRSIRKSYRDNRFKKRCKKSFVVYFGTKYLRERLFDLGLDYSTAINKKVPWSILQSSRSVVISYLSSLFEGDGTAFLWSSGNVKNRIGVTFYSSSEQLAKEVHIILLKLGYKSNLGTRRSKLSNNIQYFVRLNSKYAYELAKELNVPKWKNILKCCCEKEYSIIDRSIKRYDGDWIGVVSVKKLDYKETMYDFYLPDTNSFYANGIVQHNSVPEMIYEVVVGGFSSVSSSPAQNVKRYAQMKYLQEQGVDIGEEDNLTNGGIYRGNQSIISGTGDWGFKHFAKYWKRYKGIIESQGDREKLRQIFKGKLDPEFNWKDYAIIRIPIELSPPGFMEEKHVLRQQATVHSTIFNQEYGATFPEDSDNFYRMSIIQSCVTDNPIELPSGRVQFRASLIGNRGKKYIYGVDPASESDNFAVVVLELCEDHTRVVFCWTTDRQRHMDMVKKHATKETAFYSYAARKIRDLMRVFPCDYIALDSQGGGIGVMEALHDNNALNTGELPIWTIMHKLGKDDNPILFPGSKDWGHDDNAGLHMLEMVSMSNSAYVSDANHEMKRHMENKILLFPFFDPILLAEAHEEDEKSGRERDTLEDCVMEIEELKRELTTIQHSTSQNGRDKWDTPEVLESNNKKSHLRKDRYSALLMAHALARRVMGSPLPIYNSTPAGGFASQYANEKHKGKLYSGPAWFVDNMPSLIGTYIQK